MEKPPTLREIFSAAIELQSDEERAAYLDEACGADAALRAEIDGLIQAHRDAGSFFTDGNGHEGTISETVATGHKENHAGVRIGPYKLLQQIGEGGMGSVWMAEQEKPVRRMVALKIIKAGMDSDQVIARFEAERQALALMSHPNIAKVLDAGATGSGRPYFVMELVKGVPITEFCDRNKYTPQQRLPLFIDVCRAVQHAHQKGVIHRDIKPSNVMVTLHDGVPVVKVIDFGLAKATSQKLTERTLFTAYGQMVGTPTYMSPEQAEMSGLDVDTRTDVYSLGVLLYELMTGTTPIDSKSLRKAGFAEIQRMIQQDEAPPMSTRLSSLGGSSTVIAGKRGSDPRRLSQLFRGDLDVIVAKSIDKDRSRRYTTPSEFADDVQRFLNNEAIEARPASTAYRLKKLYQRNKLSVLTTGAVACILVLATLFSIVQAIRATHAEALAAQRAGKLQVEQTRTEAALKEAKSAAAREQAAAEREKELRAEAEVAALREKQQTQREAKLREKAEQSEREAKWNTYVARLFPMQQAWKEKNYGRLAQLLDETTPQRGEPDFRGWEWYYFKNEVDLASVKLSGSIPAGQGPVAWSPKRNEFLVRNGRLAEIWDASTLERLQTIETGIYPRIAEFSPSADLIALGDRNGEIRIIDDRTNAVILSLNPLPDRNRSAGDALISGLSWSPDEKKLAVSNCYGDIGVVDLRDTAVALIHQPDANSACKSLDWHPHKPLVAAGLRYGRRTLFNLVNNETVEMEPQSLAQGHGTAWSPSGKWLALSDGRQVLIVDEEMVIHQKLDGHDGEVRDVAWFDNDVLVSVAIDHTARIWDRKSGKCTAHVQVASSPINSLTVEPGGSRILLVASEGVFLVDANHKGAQSVTAVDTSETYRAFPPKTPIELARKAEVERLTWTHDGRHVFCTGSTELYEHQNGANTARGFASFWNGSRQVPVMKFGGYLTRGMRWFEEQQVVLIGTIGGNCIQYDTLTQEFSIRRVIQRKRSEIHFDWDLPRGLGIAVNGQEFHINDASFSKPVAVSQKISSNGFNGVRWSTTSDYFTGYRWGAMKTLTTNGVVLGTGDESAFDIVWHPLADVAISAHRQGFIRIQHGASLELIAKLSGHRAPVWGVDLSPNGRRIASASSDGTVRIWDTATGQQLLALRSDGVDGFYSVRWSPDGLQLAAGTGNGKLVVWGTHSLQRTPETATTLRTGEIGKIIRQHLVNSDKNGPVIPVYGWKRYASRLEPLLTRHRRGDPIAPLDEAMNRLRREAIVDPRNPQQTRDLITAMLHLLQANQTPESHQWLATYLIETIESEIATSATSRDGWRDLATAHITLAHLAKNDDRSVRHWEDAANALTQVLELEPTDQVSRRRLEFIVSKHLGDNEIASRVEKRSSGRYRLPLTAILQELRSTGDFVKATDAWSQIHGSILDDKDTRQNQRDFANVMMKLLIEDLSPSQSQWLTSRLAVSLQAEISKQPNNQAAWEDLAQTHLMLAEIAHESRDSSQGGSKQHQQAAVDAYLKVLEFDPGNQLASTYLESLAARLPANLEIKHALTRHFMDRLQSNPYQSYLAIRISELILETSGQWQILEPVQAKSSGGATLETLEDQSILASGPVPLDDAYTIVTKGPEGPISSLRLEALTHPSLPNQGPGRDASKDHGNFSFHSFQLSVQGAEGDLTPIEIVEATADYWLKDYFSVHNWNIGGGGGGEPHTAVYLLNKPVQLASDEKLHFTMGFSSNPTYPEQKLGCFRFSVSESKDDFLYEKHRFTARKAADQVTDTWAKLAVALKLIGDQRQLTELTRKHPSAYLGLGELAAANGDWQAALGILETALDVTPDSPQLLEKRGSTLSYLDRWDEAIRDWTRATELEPTYAAQVFDRLRSANRFNEAKAFGLLAEQQRPDDSALWLSLAPTLILAEDPQAYRAFCLRAMDQAPDRPSYTVAERLIKVCLLMPPHFELDQLNCQDLLEPTAGSPGWFPAWGLSTSALFALRAGDFQKALRLVEESLSHNPNDFCRLANLAVKAMAEIELERRSDARTNIDEAAELLRKLQAPQTASGFHHLLMGRILLNEAIGKLEASLQLSDAI